MKALESSLDKFQILPVLTIQSTQFLDSLGELCIRNNIMHLEITLRTPQALSAIDYIKTKFPDLLVGAGSILNVEQLESCFNSGADFFISPGISEELCDIACLKKLVYLPGVQTPTEIMLALSYNFNRLKYFPAQPNGIERISALYGPFPHVKFCPTGGIEFTNMGEFLSLENTFCVGMTRLITTAQINENDINSMQCNIDKVKAILQG
ncbi:MAG: keto-deoxy-phosphogluconate aldolase [Moraxellaceae bacterium]|nr:MAG: keto-deoxy-phosphogluconate aldolase [Moraxellaceae bacterium]